MRARNLPPEPWGGRNRRSRSRDQARRPDWAAVALSGGPIPGVAFLRHYHQPWLWIDLQRELVPDGLWGLVAPLIPPFKPRRQGGGTPPVADRTVFCASGYALATSCAWRRLPPSFGVRPAAVHRPSAAWTRAGLWRRLHNEVLDRLGAAGTIDRSAALVDSASVQTKGGCRPVSPNPVDQGEPGAKLRI
ncbi:transposase [Streptomyces sp. NPDC057107]|uniref:transposase n=1 Tax=Streptomyces sp. NPDC057107 TaxID=3346021 RepID=UPI003645EEBF